MKDKINEFNNLYKPALERIEEIRRNLGRYCIDHALVFFNKHHIRINNELERIQYPIPSIICKLRDIQTKIGFDIATNKNYIGFVKFTFNKEEFLTFNFEAIKTFKFEVYNNWFCEEVASQDVLKQVKNYVTKSNDRVFYIKIKISNIDEINTVINNMCIKPQKGFAMYSCECYCGNQITIEAYDGQCPICGEDSPKKRKYETNCPVCNHITLVDKYGDGECKNCSWIIENLPNRFKKTVAYPNLISLDKAKKLYKEGKTYTPDLNDFLEALDFYGKMTFTYKDIECELYRISNEGGISFYYDKGSHDEFLNKEDFIKNAKIGDEFVRDVWEQVKDPNYMNHYI